MTLGEVMQAVSAFVIVQSAFNWLVDNYPRLADWAAAASPRRLADGLARRARSRRKRAGRRPHRAQHGRRRGTAAARSFGDARRRHRRGQGAEVAIAPGRAGAGGGRDPAPARARWCAPFPAVAWGGGKWRSRATPRSCSCRSAPMCRPAPCGERRPIRRRPPIPPSRRCAEALERSGSHISPDRLEEEAPWDQILSGGEKQRSGVRPHSPAAPDIIVLDEATSALDPPSQDKLMALLDRRAARHDLRQRRPSARAGGVSQPQDRAGAAPRRCPAHHRHRARCQARPRTADPALAAPAVTGAAGRAGINGRRWRSRPPSPGRHSS